MKCKSVQYSDSMHCATCDLVWDTNDSYPPACELIKPVGQKKSHSFAEVCINTAIGYVIAVTAQIFIFPLFDISVTHSQNLQIGLIFTVISIVRSYVMRRVFNYIHVR
mgnify:CR=1 FL=1